MARAVTLLLYYMVLVRLSLEDFQKRKISDRYHWMILTLSVVSLMTIPEIRFWERLAGMLLISSLMTIPALCFPGSFGGGDIKLVFSCGAFLGKKLVLKGSVLGIFFAGIWSLWMLCFQRNRESLQFPFGPCLSAGFFLVSLSLYL